MSTSVISVWKHGTKGNNIEFANIKLLEKQEPQTYAKIEWKEGFVCQDHEYEYRVGVSKYGLWLSRKPLQKEEQILQDKPPARPSMEEKEPSVSVNKDYEIATLKKRVTALESWVKKISDSAVFNL